MATLLFTKYQSDILWEWWKYEGQPWKPFFPMVPWVLTAPLFSGIQRSFQGAVDLDTKHPKKTTHTRAASSFQLGLCSKHFWEHSSAFLTLQLCFCIFKLHLEMLFTSYSKLIICIWTWCLKSLTNSGELKGISHFMGIIFAPHWYVVYSEIIVCFLRP